MELQVLDSEGLPLDAVLSVRTGTTRRQQPLPCQQPFLLPPGPAPVLVQVMGWRGWTELGETLINRETLEGLYKVPLRNDKGLNMSVTFRVEANKKLVKSEEAQEHEADDEDKAKRRKNKEESIDSYMRRHGVNNFIRDIFRQLTDEQPEDPYRFIAQKLREAAGLPPLSAPVLPDKGVAEEQQSADGQAKSAPPPAPELPPELPQHDSEATQEEASANFKSVGPPLKSALAAPKAEGRRKSDARRVQISGTGLRQRAGASLVRAHQDGRLATALDKLGRGPRKDVKEELAARVAMLRKRAGATLMKAHKDGRLASSLEQHKQPSKFLNREEVAGDRLSELRKKAKDSLVRSQTDGRLAVALANVQQQPSKTQDFMESLFAGTAEAGAGVLADVQKQDGQMQSPSRVTELRKQARETLAQSHSDGRLTTALDHVWRQADDAIASHDRAVAESASKIVLLRKQARASLSAAHKDGRLFSIMDNLFRSKSTPSTSSSAALEAQARVRQLRQRAKATLTEAQQTGQLSMAFEMMPSAQVLSSPPDLPSPLGEKRQDNHHGLVRLKSAMTLDVQTAVTEDATVSKEEIMQLKANDTSPSKQDQSEPGKKDEAVSGLGRFNTAQNLWLDSPDDGRSMSSAQELDVDAQRAAERRHSHSSWRSSLALTPSVDGSEHETLRRDLTGSAPYTPVTPGFQSFTPANQPFTPANWHLIDGGSSEEEAEIVPTPRLSRFMPAQVPLRESPSQSTTAESDDLSSFVPDRTSFPRKVMGTSANVLDSPNLSAFAPMRTAGSSNPRPLMQRAEISPRMSHFIPAQDPVTPRLSQLMPDVEEVTTPHLSNFSPSQATRGLAPAGPGEVVLTTDLPDLVPSSFSPAADGSHLGPPDVPMDLFGPPFEGKAVGHLGPPVGPTDHKDPFGPDQFGTAGHLGPPQRQRPSVAERPITPGLSHFMPGR
mmetsp:Transcript_61084/g.108624  ORF Transcript_61084/g.108624 Transcript_61084/m.108624 type:complete len:948 (+) Transcript_61084:139-2982(+)